ncbi:MAG: fimbria major subunit, partial [Muribaculaceae bacterium]|nr:fimbria major subunit [Muribaculaceae bacterium]
MKLDNFAKFLIGAGAFGVLTACSNDIDVTPDNPAGEGRSAYMTVNLRDVTSGMGTRAGENPEDFDDGNFDDGDANEYAINSARFFFFNASGTYMCEASVWNGGNLSGSTTDNITLNGNTVVVLENLKENEENPRYMLTVLNGDGFTPEATLEATATKLYNWQNTNNTEAQGRFVMTTTSYYDGETEDANGNKLTPNHLDSFYYATVLQPRNFVEGQPSDEDFEMPGDNAPETVQVYVERLAAKVEVVLGNLPNKSTYTDEAGKSHDIYKLEATVSGTPNNEGEPVEGATDIYVEILGWDLNATAPKSYFSKQFDNFSFSSSLHTPWTNWNNPGLYRSFWGAGIGYGQAVQLPQVTVDGEGNRVVTPGTLDYVSYNDIADNLGVRYANEFTNKPEFYTKENLVVPSCVSHVVLKARLCDKSGKDLDMIRATNGVLYLRDDRNANGVNSRGYLSYVLGNANTINNLNVWYLVEEKGSSTTETLPDGSVKTTYSKESVFRQVDASMVKLAASGKGTGMVKVVPNLPATGENGAAMVYATRNADGTFTSFDAANNLSLATAALEKALNITENRGDAMAYTGGASYYPIPIEHNKLVGTDATTGYKEGYYGLVRNHWYKLTINKLLSVGLGI